MKYKVVTKGNKNEVWAKGFYGEIGKVKGQKRIDCGYYHKNMYEKDKNKILIVVEDHN